MTGYYSKAKKQEPHSYKRIQSDLSEGRPEAHPALLRQGEISDTLGLRQSKGDVCPAESEFFDFVKIDGTAAETEEIIGACETVPMLSEKKVVLVEDL